MPTLNGIGLDTAQEKAAEYAFEGCWALKEFMRFGGEHNLENAVIFQKHSASWYAAIRRKMGID